MSKNHSLNNIFITRNILFEIITVNSPKILEQFFTISRLLTEKKFKNLDQEFSHSLFTELSHLFTNICTNQLFLILNQFWMKQTQLFIEFCTNIEENEELQIIDFLHKSYNNFISAINVNDLFNKIDDKHKKKKLSFILEQYLNALSPSNFLLTNKQAITTTIQTRGKNIIDGLDNLIFDINNSDNIFQISTANNNFFEIGKNIAYTAGKIVFKNDLIELIHYSPLTSKQYSIPLLIVPPCINKFYILDLQQKNSFIKWALEQNINVFLISWKNPQTNDNFSFEDYINLGTIAATNFLAEYYKKINCLGYCIGGTLLAVTNAYLEQHNNFIINNSTLLTTLLDYTEVGDIDIFTKNYNTQEDNNKIFNGNDMQYAFSLLKSKEMIWNFYVQNYLLGQKPQDFDILYWNNDSTNLTKKMHNFYIKNFYQENNFVQKKLVINDIIIDLNNINNPCYILACKDDHIAPWESVFHSTQALNKDTIFILANSGHVGGVINHPDKNKHCYWVNNKQYKDATKWLDNAKQHPGSWWNHWQKWLSKDSGKMIKIIPINKNLGDAPGSYVRKS